MVDKIITHKGKQEYELTKKQRAVFILRQYPERVSKTVVFSKMTIFVLDISYWENQLDPDWLPTLHVGHAIAKRQSKSSKETTERWERRKARTETAKEMEVVKLR